MLLSKPIDQYDHIIGDIHAPVSIVQYGDYECSICARNDHWIKNLVNEFEGSISYVFRHFPLTHVHPHSALAAVAAEVAGLDGKFWEMHELLMENHAHLTVEHILLLASDIGLNTRTFFHDLEDHLPMEEVLIDIMSGQDSGVETPPAYFLNATKLPGIVNYDSLKNDILHFLPESRDHY